MDRGYQPRDHAEAVVERLHQRREAVGGARGVGDHRVRAFQRLVVHAEDHGAVHVLLGGGRDDDLPGAGLEVRAGIRLAGETAGALHDDVDAERLPRQLRRVALRDDLDAIAVRHQRVAFHLHGAAERPVHGVVLQQVRIGGGVAEVVDRDELQAVLLAAFIVGAEDVAADAPESVDGYLDRHVLLAFQLRMLLTAFATFSGVKPKCLKRSPAGADSPNRSRPTTAPSRPTYLRQRPVTPASTATLGMSLSKTAAL